MNDLSFAAPTWAWLALTAGPGRPDVRRRPLLRPRQRSARRDADVRRPWWRSANAFAGVKLILAETPGGKLPIPITLGVIAVTLVLSIVSSLLATRTRAEGSLDEPTLTEARR